MTSTSGQTDNIANTRSLDKTNWMVAGAKVAPEVHERLERLAARRSLATGKRCFKQDLVAEAIHEKLEREVD